MYYKSGQAYVTNWSIFIFLQIRANVVTDWASFIITNQGKCCYKLRHLLEIRATVITKQGRYYKLGQNVLQIEVGITNQGNYYKLGHNNIIFYIILFLVFIKTTFKFSRDSQKSYLISIQIISNRNYVKSNIKHDKIKTQDFQAAANCICEEKVYL